MLARHDLIELRAIRRELIGIEIDLRFMQLMQVLRKFNPDQPRVPAGNPDGGQWTSAGAGAGTETDKPPNDDEVRIYPVNDRVGRFNNDLIIHESLGEGHTIKEHVGKSEEYLMNRVREFQDNPKASRFIAGSFSSYEDANELVNSVLEAHKGTVELVASGTIRGARIAREFDFATGVKHLRPRVIKCLTCETLMVFASSSFTVRNRRSATGFTLLSHRIAEFKHESRQ